MQKESLTVENFFSSRYPGMENAYFQIDRGKVLELADHDAESGTVENFFVFHVEHSAVSEPRDANSEGYRGREPNGFRCSTWNIDLEC